MGRGLWDVCGAELSSVGDWQAVQAWSWGLICQVGWVLRDVLRYITYEVDPRECSLVSGPLEACACLPVTLRAEGRGVSAGCAGFPTSVSQGLNCLLSCRGLGGSAGRH